MCVGIILMLQSAAPSTVLLYSQLSLHDAVDSLREVRIFLVVDLLTHFLKVTNHRSQHRLLLRAKATEPLGIGGRIRHTRLQLT